MSLDRFDAEYFITILQLLSSQLSSLHRRVLLRCGRKYEDGEEADPERRASARLFVVLTSGLILLGITYSFWLKNFSSYSQYFH